MTKEHKLNDNLDSLVKVEPLTSEQSHAIARAIQDRAFSYAHAHKLSALDEDEYKAALGVCTTAFNAGIHGKSVPTKYVRRFALGVIDAGLEKRAKFIARGRRTLHYLRNELEAHDNLPIHFYVTLGIKSELMEKARAELIDPQVNKEVQFKSAQELVIIAKKRGAAFGILADKILIATSGLNLDDPRDLGDYMEQKRLIDTPTTKAIKIRGYLAASILQTLKSKSDFSSNYIGHAALEDLINAAPILGTLNPNQKFVFTTSILMTVGITKDEIGPARDIVLGYFDNFIKILGRWRSTEVVKSGISKNDPRYWKNIRRFFEGLPLDPVTLKEYFFLPEGIEKAEKEGSVHLWTNAVKLGEYWIPSSQDLVFAKSLIGDKNTTLEALHYTKRVRQAIKAWYKYNASSKYPERIEKEKLELSGLRRRLKPFFELDPKTETEWRVAASRLAQYDRQLIMFNRVIDLNEKYLDFIERFQNSESPFSQVYLKIIKSQIDHEVGMLNRRQSHLVGNLLQPNLLTVTHPGMKEDHLYDIVFCQKLLQTARGWFNEMEMRRNKRLPQVFEVPENLQRFKSLLEGISVRATRYMKSDRELASKRALQFFDMPEIPKSMRKIFMSLLESNIQSLDSIIKTSVTLKGLYADQTSVFDLIEEDPEEYSQEMLDGLSFYFQEDKYKKIKASVVPNDMQDNLFQFAADLNKARKFLEATNKSAKFRYIYWTFPKKVDIEEFIASKKKDISERIEANKKYSGRVARLRKTTELLDDLKSLRKNVFIDWDNLGGQTFKSALEAIEQKVAVATALLERDQVRAQKKEIKNQLPDNITPSQYQHLQLRVKAIEARIRDIQREYENADEILLSEMKECGFAIPLSALNRIS